jgi:hypothetical protein
VNSGRGRLAGIEERRIFRSYASLSCVPTDELEALADLLKNHSGVPGPNHAGVVGPVVMAELTRRNGAECRRRPHPDGSGR